MKDTSQSLPARFEFCVVVGVAFGYLIVLSLLRGFGLLHQKAFTDNALLAISMYELVVGGALLSFLWLRGWTPAKIGLFPTFKETGIGLLLLIAANIVWGAIFYTTYFISPQTIAHMLETAAQLKAQTISVPLVAGSSFVNAAFEEIFVTGYIITALKPSRGTSFAINVSVAIRLLYHLYQGQMAVLGVLPMGLVYAFWYARSGRLWPLIVAHALQDVASLLVR